MTLGIGVIGLGFMGRTHLGAYAAADDRCRVAGVFDLDPDRLSGEVSGGGNIDTGDHVIIVNADKVVMTSGKESRQMIYRHSGYPGGLKSESFAELLDRKPADAVRRSVRGMLPKGRLGRQQMTKLKVYAGPDHPHQAQSPTPLAVPGAAAR